MAKKLSEMTAEEREQYEETLNTYARHSWIKRMLADILIDMTIAKDIRHTDPMEFPLMLKREIDNIVEQWKQKELAKDASGNTADITAKSISDTNTESLA